MFCIFQIDLRFSSNINFMRSPVATLDLLFLFFILYFFYFHLPLVLFIMALFTRTDRTESESCPRSPHCTCLNINSPISLTAVLLLVILEQHPSSDFLEWHIFATMSQWYIYNRTSHLIQGQRSWWQNKRNTVSRRFWKKNDRKWGKNRSLNLSHGPFGTGEP